jgi:hypothetical protein
VCIAAASEPLQDILDPRVKRAVGGTIPFVVGAKELLELALDDFLERIGQTAWAIARGG